MQGFISQTQTRCDRGVLISVGLSQRRRARRGRELCTKSWRGAPVENEMSRAQPKTHAWMHGRSLALLFIIQKAFL